MFRAYNIMLNVDGFLEKIGGMGRFQWLVAVVVGIMLIPVTFQALIMTFLGLEPPWRCVSGSTICNFTSKLSDMCLGNYFPNNVYWVACACGNPVLKCFFFSREKLQFVRTIGLTMTPPLCDWLGMGGRYHQKYMKGDSLTIRTG